jgi:arsenate reductase
MSENKNKINPPDVRRVKVLFLCTGNSCRSQIAEGWAKNLKSDVIEAYSAGVAPGDLNQMAVKVMTEAGVDISAQRPKHIDELRDINFDYVVTVCDNARESCPIFPRKTRLLHKSFEDPSFMTGSEQQIKAAFVKLRDQMRDFIEKMPGILEKESTKQE